MKGKIISSFVSILLTIFTVFTSAMHAPIPILAANNTHITDSVSGEADFGKGEASIIIDGNSEQTLVGKKFHIYKLFDVKNALQGESVNYTFDEEYRSALQNVIGNRVGKIPTEVTEYEVIDYIQSLNNSKAEGADAVQTDVGNYSEFRFLIEDIRDELVNLNAKPTGVVCVDGVRYDGSVLIRGLQYGYYVIDEVTDNNSEHSASSLCIVSTANPDAAVKIKSDYPNVNKKIQEDDDHNIVGNNGWSDIADFEIGQKITFKFSSKVPNVNGYDSYYYAWHDVMDSAMTFDADSVKITICENEKEYTLDKSEYKITENVNDETFVIGIDDLKAIVDAHFDHMDDLKHNTYGQEVILTYQAVLNEEAAKDTGRPGFENDVRIEFSNDPDSNGKGKTGFTPWDTVVCFTYRLNGLKVNDREQLLEGAKFRLYRDEMCQDEVYIKKSDVGYIIVNGDTVGAGTSVAAEDIVSDKDGKFVICGLDSGTYYLKEENAPVGYRPIQSPIKIEIIPEFAEDRDSYVKGSYKMALKDLSMTADAKSFSEDNSKEDRIFLETDTDDGAGNLTVVNHVGAKLPITGSSNTLFMMGVGIFAVLLSGKIVKDKRKPE